PARDRPIRSRLSLAPRGGERTEPAPGRAAEPPAGVGGALLPVALVAADDLAQLRAIMGRQYPPHGAGAGAHYQRFGGRPFAAVADPLEDVAVGDAGGGEEDVLARAEVVGCEHAVEVVAGVERGAPLLVVPGPQPAQQLAAHRLQRRRREHPLGG